MKKIISGITIIIMATICFSVTAFAATTYTSSLAFQGEHTGAKRDYTGSDMYWSGTTYTEGQLSHMPTTFSVSLYRKKFIGSTLIGTVSLPRVGTHNVPWTNVGSGKYYFYYVKARDGSNVVSDAITTRMK
ncbi:MAG: hypothetical protein IJO86_04870 [Oscillospiraceae bacterium]|nr:hypothetical protein [Oscillospiraceae bacterium]